MTIQALWKDFEHPGSAYRGKPFWAWNGRLAPEELRRQVRLMHRMGLGGFFMHARVGLATPYLSPEWFACVRACIDEAAKLGMEAWLYDEDRWPSGAAGGLVTRNPKYRMRELVMDILSDPKALAWNRAVLAAFTARVDKAVARDVRRVARGRRPGRLARGESLLVFRVRINDCSSWYNGYTYLDTLNHEAVREFIRVTHEAYRKEVGAHFGKTVPGIFADEPNYGAFRHDPDRFPWTDGIPAVFRKRYGYDLIPHLPEILFDVDGRGITPARYHFHDCLTHLFVDAFSRQIGEWCGRNGIAFTGHALEEARLSCQANMVGSCMRFYEHMQAPGMDILTEHWREYDTAKQVSSAARQFGRRWRLTETYGCTGWDFPFAGHKAIGDWQMALGINLRCQHLAWYTMEGEAKRDYPAAIFHQSPWWELYPKVEDYFARLGAVMTRGREVRDLLVIHPIESAWVLFRRRQWEDPALRAYDRMLMDVRDTLLGGNIDFDYGDEELLSRHGRVTRRGGKPALQMGQAVYTTVLVPPLLTMRATTLALLKRFQTAGGRVVFAGKPAEYVEAKTSGAVEEFAAGCPAAEPAGRALVRAVESARRVSIAGPDGREIVPALHLLREDAEAFYLFVCNVGHDFLAKRDNPGDEPMVRDRIAAFPDVRIRGFAECAGAPIELDADTGRRYAANAVRQGDVWEIRTSLPRLGSRMFVIPKRKSTARLAPRESLATVRTSVLTGARWEIALSECNAFVLDRPRYRIGKGAWQGPEEILRVDRAVRAALGVPHRGGEMVQPWARGEMSNPRRMPVTLSYAFEAAARPTGDLFLAVEQPRTFCVSFNGVTVNTDPDNGWWTDVSLRKVHLDPALVRLGRNEIRLACDYPETHPGLEIMYLLGDFGVRTQGKNLKVTAAPTSLRLGDWVPQGLACYAGSLTYERTVRVRTGKGERLFVEVPDYRGVAVRVLVDGRPAGIIGWEPNEVEITRFVKGGPARLQIEVVGHRRNSHGPFHCKEKWPVWTGPGEYVPGPKRWHDGYQLVPCGLMKPPRLTVRR